MGLLLQLRWLRRIKLRSFLEVWRDLAVVLLGLLLSVFLLLLVHRTVLVSGLLLAFVCGWAAKKAACSCAGVGRRDSWVASSSCCSWSGETEVYPPIPCRDT